MRILKIIPGSGDGFLCENCLRDQALIAKLHEAGHEVTVIPIYLPMPEKSDQLSVINDQKRGEGSQLATQGVASAHSTPQFYGAVRVYLEHRFPIFKRAPLWVKRLLDSRPILKFAAKQAATSSSKNLGDLTLSVLRGEHGGQATELDELCRWLRETQEKPDLIHLSNALLLGLARRLKEVFDVPIVCSLQDEDTWIDAMPAPMANLIWEEIRARLSDVSGFLTVSEYFASKFPPRLGIPSNLVRIVHPGIDASLYPPACPSLPPVWNVLLDPNDLKSLEFILRAFVQARRYLACANLQLHCSGTTVGNGNRALLSCLREIIGKLGKDEQAVRLSPLMTDDKERLKFIQSSSVFTVLHRVDVAFDLSLLEAMASGVPALQPASGANPEIFALAAGGVLFEPNNADALAETLVHLFADPSHLPAFAHRGHQEVAEQFTVARMAQETLAAYEMLRNH